MELHGEHAAVFIIEALYALVVHADIADLCNRRVDGTCIHHIAVVLRGNVHTICFQFFHRVIDAAVAVLELVRIRALRKRHQLVPHTDGEGGDTALVNALQLRNFFYAGLRVPGAVREHDPVRVPRLDLFKRRIVREAAHRTAAAGERTNDILFGTVIEQRHLNRAVAVIARLADADLRNAVRHNVCGDFALHFVTVNLIAEAEHAAHRAGLPQAAGERTGVDPADSGDPVVFQVSVQVDVTAKIAGDPGNGVNDKCFHPGVIGFRVLIADSVVSDHRVSHHNALACIAGVCKQFGVPAHGAVEHYLAQHVAGLAKALALKGHPVFQ